METWKHALFSLILAAALYPAFRWKVLFVLIGGVLIDIDHYFWCIYKYKKFNLIACYRFYVNTNASRDFTQHLGLLHIFHTIEFLLLMSLLSLYYDFALLFVIGLIGHYALDLAWYMTVPKRVIANHSLISWVLKNRIQKV